MLQVYFAAGVTLPLFRGLEKVQAGEAVATLFPPYYIWNYAVGGIFLVALAANVRRAAGFLPALICALLALGIVAVTQFGIAPELRTLREAGDTAAFGKLHGISMSLNLTATACVLAAGCLFRRRSV